MDLMLASGPDDGPLLYDRPPAASFFVPGVPRPAGSKRAFAHRTTGKIVVLDMSGKPGKTWRGKVAAAGRKHFAGPLLDGPLELWLAFTIPRPKRHYRTGRFSEVLRPVCQRELPTGPADVTKLIRSVEDALTKVIWVDDSQIVKQTATKTYGDTPGVHVVVRRVER